MIHLVLFLLDVIFLRDLHVVKLAYVVKVYVALLGFLHVVRKCVMDFFLFLFLVFFLGFCCAMGVRLHSPLGGKRSLGVEGLVGLPQEVEKPLPCVEGSL